MGVYYMFDNHTFSRRLDNIPIDEAMDLLEGFVDQDGGYAFLGYKAEGRPDESLQWRPGHHWRVQARAFILAKSQESSRLNRYGCRQPNS